MFRVARLTLGRPADEGLHAVGCVRGRVGARGYQWLAEADVSLFDLPEATWLARSSVILT